MSYTQRAATYREVEVLSASPGELVVILYDHLLVSLRRARIAVDAGNFELRSNLLEKCRAILSELLVTLDHERGGALSRQLSGVYAFLLGELVDVAVHGDVARLDRVTAMVTELRDAFADAAQAGAGSPA